MRYLLLRLKRFCGFITGIVFFIGGILKLMDPVGAGLVMAEYMEFLHIGFLTFAAKLLGTAFALAETVIGTALITGVWRKSTGIAALAFQGFFTLLTLALVIFNPQMDCGCFGEAVHLTHMQTFLKNIVLCVLLCTYFFPAKLLGTPIRRKYVPFAVVTASTLAFMVYSWMYIPLVDYTDYKSGALLKSAANSTQNKEDIYEATFIYRKDDIEQEFGLEDLPDSTWTFVRTETKAIAEYDTESLIDLSFYNSEGEYLDSLATEGKVLVVSIYAHKITEHKRKEISEFIHTAEEAGFKAILLTSNISDFGSDIPAYTSDRKTLLAMNRSNGGVTYFSNGFLIRKWSFRSRPDLNTLTEIMNEDETETFITQNTKGSLGFQGFLLYVFAVMLLL